MLGLQTKFSVFSVVLLHDGDMSYIQIQQVLTRQNHTIERIIYQTI